MKTFCEKHHLTYTGNRCPMCEKERVASFKVSRHTVTLPGQASRDSYFEEYMTKNGNTTEYDNISDSQLADLLASKFGKVRTIKS